MLESCATFCYTVGMYVVIPKSLERQVRQPARWRGVTETEYVRVALKQAIAEEDTEIVSETRFWDEAPLQDFQQFAKEYRL